MRATGFGMDLASSALRCASRLRPINTTLHSSVVLAECESRPGVECLRSGTIQVTQLPDGLAPLRSDSRNDRSNPRTTLDPVSFTSWFTSWMWTWSEHPWSACEPPPSDRGPSSSVPQRLRDHPSHGARLLYDVTLPRSRDAPLLSYVLLVAWYLLRVSPEQLEGKGHAGVVPSTDNSCNSAARPSPHSNLHALLHSVPSSSRIAGSQPICLLREFTDPCWTQRADNA